MRIPYFPWINNNKKKANNKTSFKSPSEPRCDVGRIGQEKKTTTHTTYPHILDDFFHKDLRENWEKSSNKGFIPSAQTPLPFHLLGTTGISVAFAGPEGCPLLVTTVTSQGGQCRETRRMCHSFATVMQSLSGLKEILLGVMEKSFSSPADQDCADNKRELGTRR